MSSPLLGQSQNCDKKATLPTGMIVAKISQASSASRPVVLLLFFLAALLKTFELFHPR